MSFDASDVSDDNGEGAYEDARQTTAALFQQIENPPAQAPGVQVGLPRPDFGAAEALVRPVGPGPLRRDSSTKSSPTSTDTDSVGTVQKKKAHPWLPNWLLVANSVWRWFRAYATPGGKEG